MPNSSTRIGVIAPVLSDRQVLDVLLRQDLAAFIYRSFQTVVPGTPYRHNWHIEAIAWALTRCARGEIKRLIITLPPRYLKSICCSVAFPAWVLGRDPTARIVCVSYANDLTVKHARDCRTVMESPWYRRVFPGTRLDPSKNTELEFATTRRGFRLGTSVGGTLTGRGGNLIIIDDPLKASDANSEPKRAFLHQWFDGTLLSRLDSKKDDVIIIVQQRVHPEDLVGYVLAKGEGWVHLDLPAIADRVQDVAIGPGEVFHREIGNVLHPEHELREVLEAIKVSIGSIVFSAHYLQQPIPLDGNLVKWDWFRTYDEAPERRNEDMITQSWDTASKADQLNDYSVCTTWLRRDKEHFLLDVHRARLDYPDLKRQVAELASRFKADNVLIEDKGSGISLIQDLKRDSNVYPIAIEPEGDKITRMVAATGKIEAGKVRVPRAASWLAEFQKELLLFPNGRYDDQVDSLSQYLGWRGNEPGVEGEVIICRSPLAEAVARGLDPEWALPLNYSELRYGRKWDP